MKKILTMVMMMTIAISAAAMSYSAARNEALFLSDKMAYELGLTATQYEAVYEINLDYLLNVDTRADVFGFWWDVRNRDLRYVLSTWQYERYMASAWFYRPLSWNAGNWTFAIYSRYAIDRMFFHRPAVFVTFTGGHNHRGSSFYAGHHFDKPNPPKGHGNHNPSTGNGGWNHNGNHNSNGNHNGNQNGFGNHNGNGNHNPSVGGGFGSSHRTASVPNTSRVSRPSGNVVSNGNSAHKAGFGGARK